MFLIFVLKNIPISNHLGQNFQTFLAVVGVAKDSGPSMLKASSAISKIVPSSGMKYIFFFEWHGELPNWIVSGLKLRTVLGK